MNLHGENSDDSSSVQLDTPEIPAVGTVQFEITPKAFANLSQGDNLHVSTRKGLFPHRPNAFSVYSILYAKIPGLARSDNPGIICMCLNPERVIPAQAPNAFSVYSILYAKIPGFSLRSNPELNFANAFGVFSRLQR